MGRRKSPWLATLLAFALGPLGYVYIHWRYMISSAIALFVLVLLKNIASFPFFTEHWLLYVNLAAMGLVAAWVVYVRNRLLAIDPQFENLVDSRHYAVMAASAIIIGVGTANAAAFVAWYGLNAVIQGKVLIGLLVVTVGTPVAMAIVYGILCFITGFIEEFLVKGAKNPFVLFT